MSPICWWENYFRMRCLKVTSCFCWSVQAEPPPRWANRGQVHYQEVVLGSTGSLSSTLPWHSKTPPGLPWQLSQTPEPPWTRCLELNEMELLAPPLMNAGEFLGKNQDIICEHCNLTFYGLAVCIFCIFHASNTHVHIFRRQQRSWLFSGSRGGVQPQRWWWRQHWTKQSKKKDEKDGEATRFFFHGDSLPGS